MSYVTRTLVQHHEGTSCEPTVRRGSGVKHEISTREAERLENITPSKIRVIFDRAAQLESEGHRILHFEIGRSDFDTPSVVKEAVGNALEKGRVHYGPNAGTSELRQAIAEDLEHKIGVKYEAQGEVLVTIGANEAVFLAIMAFCNPGDEVIIPVPAWPAYEACVRLAGGTPVFLPLEKSDDFKLNPDKVRELINPRTRMVVVCTPHNPTGAVLSGEHLEKLSEALKDTNVLVLSDEIYSQLIYGTTKHVSPATIQGLYERTFVVNGFAKAYAMDGWRLGWLSGPKNLIAPALRVRQFTTTCAPTFLQDAAEVALQQTDKEREMMRRAFAQRRDTAMGLLAEQELLEVSDAHGAFYLYLWYPESFGPSDEIAMRILEEENVAIVPGTAFDPTGNGNYSFRFSYARSLEEVTEGVTRMIRFFKRLETTDANIVASRRETNEVDQ